MSGLPWKGNDQETGADMGGYVSNWLGKIKATRPFNTLPNLEGPGTPGPIGQEFAILNYIGRKVPAMAGESDADFCASQQIMYVAEDIYGKLDRFAAPTAFAPKTDDHLVAARKSFWAEPDATQHNSTYGAHVYLTQLDDYYTKLGLGGGKFTTTGRTVGECKLFSSLHALVMCKSDILSKYAGLTAFYDRFKGEKETAACLENGGNYPHKFAQYFQPPTDA